MQDDDQPQEQDIQPQDEGQEPAEQDQAEPKVFDEDYVKKLRSEAASWRTKAQQAAAKVQEFEDRDKSEAEKQAERLAELEAEARAAKEEAMRLRVIADTQLDPELHEFLVGDDEEQLRAKAEKLKSYQERTRQPEINTGRPKERLRGGSIPDEEPTLVDQIRTAEQAGDWATARRLKSAQLLAKSDKK